MSKARSRQPIFLLLAAFFAVGSSAEARAQWFAGIGDLAGGGFESKAFAVSNTGRVVASTTGEVILPGYPPVVFVGDHAAIWDVGTGLRMLPEEILGAIDISADGSVVLGQTPEAGGVFNNYLWTEAGGAVDTGVDGFPRALSQDGTTVVGRGYNEAGGYVEAYRWSQAGGLEGLGALPHTNLKSEAHGVSADGNVVAGTSSNYSSAPGFRWEDGAGMAPIGATTGVPRAVMGVSGDGQTVFGYAFGSGFGAFLWTVAGGYVFVGNTFTPSIPKTIKDVSYDGTKAVGGNAATTLSSAFIWDPVKGMRELSAVLEGDLGLDLAGWTLLQANGVSPNGRYVVGEGINPAGDREGFVAYFGPGRSCGLGAEVALFLPLLLLRRRGRRRRAA